MFRKTKLTGVSTTVQQAFKNNRPLLVDKTLACVTNRFDDLHSIDAGCPSLKFCITAVRHAVHLLQIQEVRFWQYSYVQFFCRLLPVFSTGSLRVRFYF